MKKNKIFLAILGLLVVMGFVNCADNTAEVSREGAVLYSEPELKTKVADVKKGTVVEVCGFRNHKWGAVKQSIHVKTDKAEGYMDPQYLVVFQDPKTSIFKQSKRKEGYEYFYNPKDKEHYPKKYEYGALSKLPKDKVPLDELLK